MDGEKRVGGMMAATNNPPRDGEGDRAERGGGGSQSLRRPVTYSARKLRKEMSLPEVLLWQELRGGKTGAKFRRQHPVGPYVADFYCSAARLIVEIDGEAHNRGARPERDAARDKFLSDAGYRVLRIAATDVLKNLDAVVQTISVETGSPLHRASAVPLPASGEDLA
jgi:very-short-patch-repair endonuclease